jgi:hypothetical protein
MVVNSTCDMNSSIAASCTRMTSIGSPSENLSRTGRVLQEGETS